MNEREWLTCNDPEPMLAFLRGRASPRKWRLFACACVREVGHLLLDERSRHAYFVAERFADGRATAEELTRAQQEAHAAWLPLRGPRASSLSARLIARKVARTASAVAMLATHLRENDFIEEWHVARMVTRVLLGSRDRPDPGQEELLPLHADLMREVFGNPFRRPRLPVASLRWQDNLVRRLALTIYEERSFDELPVLRDALLDAGCEHPVILDHCARPGGHGRGCWVVDQILCKK